MKKIVSLLIVTLMLTGLCNIAHAESEIKVYLNGEKIEFDVPPMLINDRTLVPMRAIFEALGAQVEWDDATNTVIASAPGVILELPIGSYTISRNTLDVTIDVPAQLVSDRTLVPIRVVSEFMGANVEWNESSQSIYISSTDKIRKLDWNDHYYYVGETENNSASGYGALYRISDNDLYSLGRFDYLNILEGTVYYTNGDIFFGQLTNSQPSYGTYYYSKSGDYYIGNIENYEFEGYGEMYYSDGSYFMGNWSHHMKNGQGTYYDSYYDTSYTGNWTDDKKNGVFVIDDYENNYTYSVEYKNGEVYDEEKKQQEIYSAYQQEMNEYYAAFDELQIQYEELSDWYINEQDELYDYILYGDPFSTDWAQSIYEDYGVNTDSTSYDGMDSFAAANAARQQAALKRQADAAILEYNQTYINNWQELIEQQYQREKASLDSIAKTLELQKEQILFKYGMN